VSRRDPREVVGGVLFLGAIVAALVLIPLGLTTGWPVLPVLVAFIAGGLLLADS
jgi:hypothetical protein